jgi:hypothetical protein
MLKRLLCLSVAVAALPILAAESQLRLATFRADVTPPIGAPLCGGLVKPVTGITDPLLALGVPTISPAVDGTRYFWFHHSSGDTMDKLDPREMAENVAFLAVTAFVAADMPGYLPRSPLRPAGR